ncbi:uncharacterized protein F13E9.13, mitochondrial-like [Oppia nitens]|uniref:uncharacterized protein F13E9.13, mitochondrial-like n=1 Tax=Oppia nitens TaxID=1686743 RepID=UPI0023DB7A6D|nr:uncharacterized protein F13E9.13, mitochondrial-like [Oppia nitens]
MNRFGEIFRKCLKNKTSIIGMVHVRSLPNCPLSRLSVQQLVDISCAETEIYKKYQLDGICVENMFDVPYVTRRDSGPEVTAVMTRVCAEVKKCAPNLPIGVQILAALNQEAVAVAVAAGLQFVRCESFVFGHIADEGYMDGCAGSLLRYRRHLNADHILVLTDIKKKHSSHSITSDVSIGETAKSAQFFLSDGLIITGQSTGHFPKLDELKDIQELNLGIPLLIGSGVDDNNVGDCIEQEVSAVIVGSHFKKDGLWSNDLCENRISRFMDRVHQCSQ